MIIVSIILAYFNNVSTTTELKKNLIEGLEKPLGTGKNSWHAVLWEINNINMMYI